VADPGLATGSKVERRRRECRGDEGAEGVGCGEGYGEGYAPFSEIFFDFESQIVAF